MATRYTDEFRRDAVRIATTSGLTRTQVSSDLGVGLSTLNKWVQKHQHDDLMSGPHEEVERENERLRKEVRLLRDKREVLKKRGSTDRQGYAKHDPERFLCRPKSVRFAFIDAWGEEWPVEFLCWVMNRPQFAGGSKVSMDGAHGKK